MTLDTSPPPPGLSIHRLGPDDLEPLDRVLDLFAEVFDDDAAYRSARPGAAYSRKLLASDDFFLVAALQGEAVVGALAAYTLHKFEQERSEVYLYDLAVSAAHRRRGIATALIRRMQALAASSGAYVVMVQADPGDEPAIALYTKLGVREDVLHFDLHVPG